ncbi:MAG: hypothetical protein HY543_04295 [Deltaproteobacteria bacterium]|nr:hypothetical protein [Deltaproteobacteria bacterium]
MTWCAAGMMMIGIGCGGGGATTSGGGAGDGRLALKVTNATSTSKLPRRAQIASYHVRIEGPDMEPVEAVFSGQAGGGEIAGIPAGADRAVTVTARNAEDDAVRIAEAEGVRVESAVTTSVPLTMEIVPIVTNLSKAGTIANTQLRFALYAAPGARVALEAASMGEDGTLAASPRPLIDTSLNAAEVVVDTATGIGIFVPSRIAPGRYQFAARDVASRRQSVLTLKVTDGAARRGVGFVAAATPRARLAATRTNWPLFRRLPPPRIDID